jgi:hypothetical protein
MVIMKKSFARRCHAAFALWAILVIALMPGCVPKTVTVTVFFTDTIRYATGGPPFEVAVSREVNADANLPEAVLLEFFKGPMAEESALGYEAITDGFTGFSSLEITEGIARVHLTGICFSNGATYTIAQPLFEQVQYVKIFDQNGQTWEPDGPSNSIPACLEP